MSATQRTDDVRSRPRKAMTTAPRRGRKVTIVRECAVYQDIDGFYRCCYYDSQQGEKATSPARTIRWPAKMYSSHKTAPSRTQAA